MNDYGNLLSNQNNILITQNQIMLPLTEKKKDSIKMADYVQQAHSKSPERSPGTNKSKKSSKRLVLKKSSTTIREAMKLISTGNPGEEGNLVQYQAKDFQDLYQQQSATSYNGLKLVKNYE